MKIIYLIIGFLLFAFSLDAQYSDKKKDFLFVGHRGASYLAPENEKSGSNIGYHRPAKMVKRKPLILG